MRSRKLKHNKVLILIVIMVCICFAIRVFPSLARVKNRSAFEAMSVWDGSVASSYRGGSGTKSDPYVIATGSELAYLASMLKSNSYEGKYFTLSNDIIINNGILSYEEGTKYTLNKSTFYLKENTTDYYDNPSYDGVKIGSINSLESLNNFKGHFDGRFHTIYGLYINSSDVEAGLFTNLNGEVKNLYVMNSLVNGGNITGGIASSSTDATLKNVVFGGSVIGKKEVKRADVVFPIDNLTSSDGSTSLTMPMPSDYYKVEGSIIDSTLTGSCTDDFRIDGILVSCIENSFTAKVTETSTKTIEYESTLELSNLKLDVLYNTSIVGGIIGTAKNSRLENVINKSNVISPLNAGGLVGQAMGYIDIDKSYNIGSVTATSTHAGLIGTVKSLDNSSRVANCYNDGTGDLGLIGSITNSGEYLSIENSFDAQKSSNTIKSIDNSKVRLNNVYTVGSSSLQNDYIEGEVSIITRETLLNKSFGIDTLGFREYIDSENVDSDPANAWIWEDGYLPTTYIDDVKDPLATLNLGVNSWNSLSYELDTMTLSTNTAFSISEVSNVRPIKEAYYYISDDRVPLLKNEIDAIEWTPYEAIVPITEDGYHIVYVKVVDQNGKVSYLNSDIIMIDKTEPTIEVTGANKSWNSYKEELNYTYIDEEVKYNIASSDELSGVKSIEYYIANEKLERNELDSLDWTTYKDDLSISVIGTHIIYIRVVDHAGNIAYINTDYIIYKGYSLVGLFVGIDTENKSQVYMNDKSNVTYHFTSNDELDGESKGTHHLIASIPLPTGVKVTLEDNVNGGIYVYEVTSPIDSIAFTSFKEVGKGNMAVEFKENSSTSEEDFRITLDFMNARLDTDILNLKVHIELHDSDSNIVRSTIKNTLRDVNIYKSKDYSVSLTGIYFGSPITYNSDSVESIKLTTGITPSVVDEKSVYDSSYDEKKLGIAIRLVDENGTIVPKSNMKNVRFKVGDNYYSPDNDGITRIKVSDDLSSVTNELTIITSNNKSELREGQYYFKINGYSAYDGVYSKELSTDEIVIPVLVQNDEISMNYDFNVKPKDDYKVLFKNRENVDLEFDIVQSGEYSNPNIRVSLYKKDKLTAYDQTYTLVDLKDHTTTALEKVMENMYYASKNPVFYDGTEQTYNHFGLNLNLSEMSTGGYKFIFELYDGNKRIGSIEDKFIIR